MLFCHQTQQTHSYYHLVTAEPPFILTRIGMKQDLGMECSTLAIFVEHLVKSQWRVLVGYLTILTNVSYCHARCRRQYYLPFSNIAHACTSAWFPEHSSTAAAQTSFFL